MKTGRVYTAKQWRKYKAKQAEKIANLIAGARTEGRAAGIQVGKRQSEDAMAAIIYHYSSRERTDGNEAIGRVTIHPSLVGKVSLIDVKRDVDGNNVYQVAMKDIMP